VLETLKRFGHEAYFVGGCVRDRVAGRPVHDIDIATSAKPEEIVRAFPRTVPTGIRHGTVTVLMRRHAFEVTTFRKESEYEDFRRPKSVEFVSDLYEDLRRRDFTLNAMAMDADGRLIDPFGGKRDLEAGVLRSVGSPEERFREDALRMLRCIRFACEFGLSIEPNTWNALLANAPLLEHIAMERVRTELEKTFEGRDPTRGVAVLAESGLFRHFREPLGFSDEAWLALPSECSFIGALSRPETRWAAIWIGLGATAERAVAAMRRLRFSLDKIESISSILAFGRALGGIQPGGAKTASSGDLRERWTAAVLRHGERAASGWLEWARAAGAVRAGAQGRLAEGDVEQVLENGEAWTLGMRVARREDLAVGGDDLMRLLHRPPGRWLGRLLDELTLDAALGRVANEREALLEAALRKVGAGEGGKSR